MNAKNIAAIIICPIGIVLWFLDFYIIPEHINNLHYKLNNKNIEPEEYLNIRDSITFWEGIRYSLMALGIICFITIPCLIYNNQ